MTDGTSTLGEWGRSRFSQQIRPNEQRNNLSVLWEIYRAPTDMSSLARKETVHCKQELGRNSQECEKEHFSPGLGVGEEANPCMEEWK